MTSLNIEYIYTNFAKINIREIIQEIFIRTFIVEITYATILF